MNAFMDLLERAYEVGREHGEDEAMFGERAELGSSPPQGSFQSWWAAEINKENR